ncbi:FecR family protein [Oscillatoria sp. FACHB-1406]|uniref:FecR family protein n=1 Tax=Oscillatoria sp. FACHB-1406 TaxID=2692846 RepID=UPI001685305B|nr:FecR family protein [Oscillatoria sp. FACHB-1406]MBD2576878.1 FecR domain-containing protein [Oscillatoria sp. FACHB-1406]
MLRSIFLLSLWIACSTSPFLFPGAAKAQTALTRAVIESLRNRARLIPQNQAARAARASDAMRPGDAIATAASSTVDLRFNDRSLARLGEQAVFRFAPGTRSVDLSRGTLLLLATPGQGRTNVRTPNSAAGVRGSALFVRYIPETDTTLVGALTNSQIEVFNRDASDRVELRAGQMAAIVQDQIRSIYNFDLQTFYQTSPLVEDLNLTQLDAGTAPDEAMNQVRAEVQEGVETQTPVPLNSEIVNPDFTRMIPLPVVAGNPESDADFPEANATVVSFDPSEISVGLNRPNLVPNLATLGNPTNVRSLVAGGEIQTSLQRQGILVTSGGSANNNGCRGQGGCNRPNRSNRPSVPPGLDPLFVPPGLDPLFVPPGQVRKNP